MPGPSADPSPELVPVLPEIPQRLQDPRPVLLLGTLAFAIAWLIVALGPADWHHHVPVCIAGTAVGALGSTIFIIQRSGARRGRKGAQLGL